jgi:hypothetical protein
MDIYSAEFASHFSNLQAVTDLFKSPRKADIFVINNAVNTCHKKCPLKFKEHSGLWCWIVY